VGEVRELAMDSFYIIALALGGAAVGGIAGAWRGEGQERLVMLLHAPVGALSGGLAGVVAGAFLFA
jgi:outer membrane lipoprotein SlyB